MTRFERMRAGVLLATWTALAVSGPLAGSDGPGLAQWTHVADVQADAPSGKGVVELSLPPEVFAKARSDLADLRLASEAGGIVPYVLRVDMGKAGQSVSYEPKRMFNRVFVPRQRSSVTVDFGTRAKRTDIEVDTPGTNFRRRVQIEASQDGQSWQVLRKTAWLFRIAREGAPYDHNRVALPDNDFRRVRITVFHAPDDPEEVPIRRVRARYLKSVPPRTVDVPLRSTEVRQKPRIKASEVLVDLGYENLPLHEVTMSFKDASFLRRVAILGRNRAKRTVVARVEGGPPRRREVDVPWTHLAGGTVHRFPSPSGEAASAGLSLRVAGPCRYLLVRIHNADNAPLTFTGIAVRRLQHYLAFQAKDPAARRLYLGNPAARAPRYDLVQYVDRLRAEGVAPATLGPVAANPLFAVEAKAIPWSERYRGLLWGVLLAVLLVLAVLVARQARRVRPDARP